MTDFPACPSTALETLERIRRDRARSSETLSHALSVIEERLLEPGFSADALFREISAPEEDLIAAFRDELGEHPRDYIDLAQTEIAARELLESGASIEGVALKAGRATGGSLNHYCHRFFGLAPRELQSRARAARARGLEPRFSAEGLWRWLRGEATREEVEEHSASLDEADRELGINTVSRMAAPGAALMADLGEDFDLQLEPLLEMPDAERRALVRRGAIGCSAEVFEVLSERSRARGRQSRRRGVELAELALALVEGNAERLGEASGDLHALAWARLGNARMLAGDYEEAEADLGRSEKWIPTTTAGKAACRAEILAYRGTLRLFQRRYSEAETLLGKAIYWSRVAGDAALEVGALQQRAALFIYRGEPRIAIPDLKTALSRTPEEAGRPRLGSIQQLLSARVLSESFAEIGELLPEAYRLAAQIDDEPTRLQVHWVEGLYLSHQGDAAGAERLLLEAHAGFGELGDVEGRAVVALDLALLYNEQGRAPDALERAAEALPALEALGIPEALRAFGHLRRSLEKQAVQRDVLETARRRLCCPAAPL